MLYSSKHLIIKLSDLWRYHNGRISFYPAYTPDYHEQDKNIAKNNGRSVNKEIEQILKWVVDDYERKYGRITLTNEEMPKSTAIIEPLPEEKMERLFKLEK